MSNLGDGIALAAGPLLIASQTRDPLLDAMAVLLQQLPWLLFVSRQAHSPTGWTAGRSS